jgi:hypothetical protein
MRFFSGINVCKFRAYNESKLSAVIAFSSNININFEYGKRGTTYYNLVEENYFNISVGLSLSDKWFIKRKFD